MPRPLVSVLIDTYNHERFIEDALSSVFDQDFPESEREIIVVDDGSTDQTANVLRKYGPSIQVLTKQNGGQASAFNHGIRQCRGEFISFLDGDDWWARNKLSKVVDVLARDAQVGLVGSGIIESFPDGSSNLIRPEKSKRLRLDSLNAARTFRLNKSFLGASRMTIRGKIARSLPAIPEELTIEADEFLFTLTAALSEVVILEEALTYYRIHGGNLYAASKTDSGKRRKQHSLAALAAALRSELKRDGVSDDVANCLVEIIQAEADQLRLSLDGGSRLETLRTERTIFGVLHANASFRSRAFRTLSMIPALLLPPRWFYGGRRWLGSQSWYRKTRNNLVPVPPISGETRPGRTDA